MEMCSDSDDDFGMAGSRHHLSHVSPVAHPPMQVPIRAARYFLV
jgi:hypothetical protein